MKTKKVIQEIMRVASLLIIFLPLIAIVLLLLIRGSQVLPERWDD